MKSTIIYTAIILIVLYKIINKFISELKKDNAELDVLSLEDKFALLIKGLNEYSYQGEGEITKISKRKLSLYKKNSNQIIFLDYGTGILTINWKIKYFQQEMKYRQDLYGARDVNQEWQEKALQFLIAEFEKRFILHKSIIDEGNIPDEMLSKYGISKENWMNANEITKQMLE